MEHGRLLAGIGVVLGLGGPYEEVAVPRVWADPPGRSVLAGAIDEREGVIARVAWVENVNVLSGYGTGGADEIRLHVAGPDLGHQHVRLYHYNPYFGTRVLLMRFYGDALVVVYHEKHNTYVVRVTPPSTEIHSVNVHKNPEIHGDVVVWTEYHEDLLRHLCLPGLARMVPLPLPPQRGLRTALGIEDGPDGTFVRWVDQAQATAPGVHPIEWKPLEVCRLRLPTGAEGELPTGKRAVREIWQGLRARLEDPSAPPDGPDVLIATAATPFWYTPHRRRGGHLDARGDHERRRRGAVPQRPIGTSGPFATSSWWFAAAYWSYLSADALSGGGRPGDAERWLVWLEQLATPAPVPYHGWDPTWGPVEGAVQLGLIHLRRRAGQIAAACRAGDLPTDLPTRANTKGQWAPAPPAITDLPEGFLRAWDQIPDDFPYPNLNLSSHYN